MARYWATASPRAVSVFRDGLRVDYRQGDFSGDDRGGGPYTPPGGKQPARPVGVDSVDMAVEEMGYVAASASSWKWVEEQGHYRFAVAPEDAPRFEEARRAGAAAEAAVNLEIARTGKRPSGKPLTPEQRQWVVDYNHGKREFR